MKEIWDPEHIMVNIEKNQTHNLIGISEEHLLQILYLNYKRWFPTRKSD